MRYESAMNSAGEDDVALAKSFIIACEGPVLNWYSLLPPHSVYNWVDLKTEDHVWFEDRWMVASLCDE
jgi:hypothetical protein